MKIDLIIVNNIIACIIGLFSILTTIWGAPKVLKKWQEFAKKKFDNKIKGAISEDINEIKTLIQKLSDDSEYIKSEINRQSSVDHDIQLKLDRLEKHNLMLNDLSIIPTFLCDKTGNVFYVNTAFCEMLKTGRNELLHYGWQSFIDQDYFRENFSILESALKNGRAIYNLSVDFRLKNNDVFSATINCYPVANGEVREFVGQVVLSKN